MGKWINIHTHRPGKGLNIVDPCLGNLDVQQGEIVLYSVGVHPMFIDEEVEMRLEEIRKFASDGEIVAIGEAGLDRNVYVPMERQMDVFKRQVLLAAEYDLPLIIHGVRAVSEIVGEAKRIGNSHKWILHGFNNRREVMSELLRHGMCLSVGRQVMNEASHAWQMLPEIPRDRLFLETDNSEWGIDEIYNKVAQRLEMREEELQDLIQVNYRRLFQR